MTVKELLEKFGTNRKHDKIVICDADTLDDIKSFTWDNDGKFELRRSEYADREVDFHNIEIGTFKTVLVNAQILTDHFIEWRIYVYPDED